MKIGVNCPACASDHWINFRGGKARCGVCTPSRINLKREWPRMIKLQHREYYRKNRGLEKKRVMVSHTVAFTDYELAKCVAVSVEKIKADQGGFYYKVVPVFNTEFKTFREAKGYFTRKKL